MPPEPGGTAPGCYKDAAEHDPNDKICIDCPWEAWCAVAVAHECSDPNLWPQEKTDLWAAMNAPAA